MFFVHFCSCISPDPQEKERFPIWYLFNTLFNSTNTQKIMVFWEAQVVGCVDLTWNETYAYFLLIRVF